MAGRESTMWKALRPQLLKSDPSAHLVRIENATEKGTPDVEMCWHGTHAWIELKCIEKRPKDPLAIVTIGHYTSDQRLWLRSRGRAGGRAFLLLRILQPYGEWLLFRWQEAFQYVGRVPINDLISHALVRCTGPQIDAEAFRFAILLTPDRTPP